jgi:hypothetical protein
MVFKTAFILAKIWMSNPGSSFNSIFFSITTAEKTTQDKATITIVANLSFF